MSRAVVIVPGATLPQQNAITTYFRNNSQAVGFWHWGSDTWLVTSETDPLDTVALRDSIMGLAPGPHVVVLKVEPSDQVPNWAVLGPPTWADWLTNSWEKKKVGP